MKRLIGYLHTLKQYVATPKGRHDIVDYLYASSLFLMMIMLIVIFLRIVG